MTDTIEQFAARVCDKIVTALYADAYPSNPVTVATGILRDELATLPPRVVEVTEEDVEQGMAYRGTRAITDTINARLNARATTNSASVDSSQVVQRPAVDVEGVAREIAVDLFASDIAYADRITAILRRYVTDTGWITVPTTQTAGAIKTPSDMGVTDGLVVVDWSGEKPSQIMPVGNWIIAADCHRWCVPGQPWVERTPTTTRAWTAESVQPCVGRHVVSYDKNGETIHRHWDHPSGDYAAYIASIYNDEGATRIFILPEAR